MFGFVDVMHAHQDAITQMFWLDKIQVLMTSSKDKKIKVGFKTMIPIYFLLSFGNFQRNGVTNPWSKRKTVSI